MVTTNTEHENGSGRKRIMNKSEVSHEREGNDGTGMEIATLGQ